MSAMASSGVCLICEFVR